MKRKFKPVIFLGLGTYGSQFAVQLKETVHRKQPDLAEVVSCVTLDDEGSSRISGSTEPKFQCNDLRATVSVESYQCNFRVYQDHEKEFEDLLSDAMEEIRQREILLELQEKGYRIDDGINIYIFSALFDPIGSVAIVPFLGFIQTLLVGRFRGTLVETNLLGFFPDLFNDFKRERLAYLRSYVSLQELDHIINHPKLLSLEGRAPLTYTYLFTGKNEDGVEIGSYDELIPMISEVLSSLLFGEIASDNSFSVALLNNEAGKLARYSSFGLAKVIFPVDEIMDGLTNALTGKLMDFQGLDQPKVFERDYVAADVKEFLVEYNFDKLSSTLKFDKEGKTIWTDFKFQGAINEKVVIENFMRDVERQAEEFDRDGVTLMDKKLSDRRRKMFDEKIEELIRKIYSGIDSSERGIYYSKAFLDMFQNQKSSYTRGEFIAKAYTLDLIEKEAKSFFDGLFGIERGKLTELKRDIDDKTELLQKAEKEFALDSADASPATTIEEKGDTKEAAEARQKRVDALREEIKNLQEKYDTLEEKIADFDFKITDPSERRRLLSKLLEHEGEEKEKLRNDLLEADQSYMEEKRRLNELYEERKRFINRVFVMYPLLGTLVYVGILFGATKILSDFDIFQMIDPWLVIVYPLLFMIYGFLGFTKYWLGIRKQILECLQRCENFKGQKISLLLKFQEFYNRHFKTIFDHSLQGSLIGWIDEYKSSVQKTAERLQRFIDEIADHLRRCKDRYDNITFLNTLFVRSVVTKKDLDSFLDRNVRLTVEMQRFFRDKPLSVYFEDFRTSGSILALEGDIRRFTEDVFRHIREKSIEEFLCGTEIEAALNATEKLFNLYDSAKTFILLDVEKGMDVSQSLVYLGVRNVENSQARELLRKQGQPNIFAYSTGNKNEIVISKLKIGFPAFHIALVGYGKHLVSNTPESSKFYVNDEWQLEDLFPTTHTFGDEEDEVRTIICLGKAFGLICQKNAQYFFEDKILGETDRKMNDYLRSFRASTVRVLISQRIEERKHKHTAVEELINYKVNNELDVTNLRIIDKVINEISPLA
ncbi:MAG: hypothetical protein HY707_03940 [Ignavibacteriae bacterium]|nr:hypothetical protein [Ignavibacteriota bacterium]